MELLAPQPCFSRWHVSSDTPRHLCFGPTQLSGFEQPRTPPMPYKNLAALKTSGTFDTMRGLHPSVFQQLLPPEPLSYPVVNLIIKGPAGQHRALLK